MANNSFNLSSQEIIYEAEKDNNWCLCIFFSVDIEGATAYKVETRTKGYSDNDWCTLFESFYTDFPKYFFSEYDHHTHIQPAKCPVLWKFVGDEILFYAPLTDSYQTLDHLDAFCQTIINYNQRLEDKRVEVRCKGTAWIAGFPVNNRIILISDYAQKQSVKQYPPIVDFIGSSIDCGFRLTKFASPRMLVVSLDLLWIVSVLLKQHKKDTRFEFIGTNIKYAGRQTLKGVFSGQPYPVFGIDLSSKSSVEDNKSVMASLESKWIAVSPPCDRNDIVSFCKELSSHVDPSDFIEPFIANDVSGLFKTITNDFEKQRNTLISYKNTLRAKKQATMDSEQESKVESNPPEVQTIKSINSD
jgi:hypothetical protein